METCWSVSIPRRFSYYRITILWSSRREEELFAVIVVVVVVFTSNSNSLNEKPTIPNQFQINAN